jgi:hypothetical protein
MFQKSKIPKRIKKNFRKKRKGKVALHFFAFGWWDKPALWLPYKRTNQRCLLLSSLEHLSF